MGRKAFWKPALPEYILKDIEQKRKKDEMRQKFKEQNIRTTRPCRRARIVDHQVMGQGSLRSEIGYQIPYPIQRCIDNQTETPELIPDEKPPTSMNDSCVQEDFTGYPMQQTMPQVPNIDLTPDQQFKMLGNDVLYNAEPANALDHFDNFYDTYSYLDE